MMYKTDEEITKIIKEQAQKNNAKEREYQVRLIADAIKLALEEYGVAKQPSYGRGGGPR